MPTASADNKCRFAFSTSFLFLGNRDHASGYRYDEYWHERAAFQSVGVWAADWQRR